METYFIGNFSTGVAPTISGRLQQNQYDSFGLDQKLLKLNQDYKIFKSQINVTGILVPNY